MPRTFTPRVKGLNLLIDRKQSAEPYVVAGKNFVMDAQGPVSGLGRDLVSYKAIDSPTNIDVFEISETVESFICTNVGIFRLDTDSRKLVPKYIFATLVDSQFPWSFCAVGNSYYFARKDFGLLEYDISSYAWTKLTGGSIPDNIYACEESEGRLILLTDLWVAWSSIGNGQDFIADTDTGAGAQALTKMGRSRPVPLGIKKTPEGFLTFTSAGIMRSQAIDAVAPFRHTILSSEHAPINPYCMSKTISQSIVFLTKAGLFETSGQVPVPWQILMSEYLHVNILNKIDYINNQNNPRLGFDFDNTWFVISLSAGQTAYGYTRALVLNLALGEFGSFDAPFVSLNKFKILPVELSGYTYGVVDTQGSIFVFNSANGVEQIPELDLGLFYYKPWVNYESVVNDDVLMLRTNGNWNTISTNNLTLPAVYNRHAKKVAYLDPIDLSVIEYAWEIEIISLQIVDRVKTKTTFAAGIIETATVQQAQEYASLNSSILVGPYKIVDEQVAGRYIDFTGLIIGMSNQAVGDTEEDWGSELQYPFDTAIDWNAISGEEDWGFAVLAGVDYDLTLLPTLDAYTEIVDNEAVAELVKIEGVSRIYSCAATGIYLLVEISAEEVDQNFHLKTLDIDYFPGGYI